MAKSLLKTTCTYGNSTAGTLRVKPLAEKNSSAKKCRPNARVNGNENIRFPCRPVTLMKAFKESGTLSKQEPKHQTHQIGTAIMLPENQYILEAFYYDLGSSRLTFSSFSPKPEELGALFQKTL